MSETIERSRFWVFDEQQLASALEAFLARAYGPNMNPTGVPRRVITEFLNSPECADRGMRRGGED